MIKDAFEKLGFTSSQAEIYAVLAELGETQIGKIIRKTGFHRNILTRGLDYLIEKKLVGKKVKNGTSYYFVLPAVHLIEDFKNKRKTAEKIAQLLNTKQPHQPDIFIFKGSSGVAESFEIEFEGNNDVYLLGLNYTLQTVYKEIYEKLQARYMHKGLKRYILAQPQYRKKKLEALMGNAHIRYLPKNFPRSPLVIAIYHDNIGLYMWEETPLIIFIRSKDIAEGYKNYFQLLWHQARG